MNYVYLLRAGHNHYKVGVANSVVRRLKELQTANPERIEIVTTKLVDDAYRLENEMHTYLAELKADGGREWFKLTCEQAIDLAIMINRAPEIDISNNIRLRDILAQQSKKHETIEAKLDIVLGMAELKIKDDTRLQALKEQQVRSQLMEKKQSRQERNDEVLYSKAVVTVRNLSKASTSMLQRHLEIGYGRAARLIDRMEREGLITAQNGARPRQVIM